MGQEKGVAHLKAMEQEAVVAEADREEAADVRADPQSTVQRKTLLKPIESKRTGMPPCRKQKGTGRGAPGWMVLQHQGLLQAMLICCYFQDQVLKRFHPAHLQNKSRKGTNQARL